MRKARLANEKRLESSRVQALAPDEFRVNRYRRTEPLGAWRGGEKGAGVDEHPQYRMWKDRLEDERQADALTRVRSAARELSLAEWQAAWASYKARVAAVAVARPVPRWWNLFGWMRWLLRLHTPGRPG